MPALAPARPARSVAAMILAVPLALVLVWLPPSGQQPVAARPAAAGGSGAAATGDGASRGDDLDRLRADRQALEADLDALTAELDDLAVRITDAREARQRLTGEVRALEAEALEAEEALRSRALAVYRSGPGDPVGLLLSASGPGEALARSRLLGGLGTRERAMIERATVARAAYGQRRRALDEVVADLRTDERRLAMLQEQVSAAFASALAAETALDNLRARQRRVSRSGQRGVYACPVAAPHFFRNTWGAPRSGGRRHRGVDIFAPMGADVYAITSGSVLRHSSSRLGGIGLYLAGDDGNQYYYAHLQQILPAYGPGRRVEAGELIARNGATGNASANAPHVHLEVRPGGGRQVNPHPYAAAACY